MNCSTGRDVSWTSPQALTTWVECSGSCWAPLSSAGSLSTASYGKVLSIWCGISLIFVKLLKISTSVACRPPLFRKEEGTTDECSLSSFVCERTRPIKHHFVWPYKKENTVKQGVLGQKSINRIIGQMFWDKTSLKCIAELYTHLFFEDQSWIFCLKRASTLKQ